MDLKSIIEKLEKAEQVLSAEEISFLKGLKTVNIESVKEFVEKDEAGKKYLQSVTDAAVTKGINTFKEKSMPALLEDEIKKKFPAETEEQKRLRVLEDDNKKFQNEVRRANLLNKAMQVATEKGLPVKLISNFLGEDEDTTLKNLELLEQEFSGSVKNVVENRFKDEGRNPPQSNTQEKMIDELSKMSTEEYINFKLKNQK